MVCHRCVRTKEPHKIILCDRCDAAYHIYCLDPPLRRIPPGDWLCTSCSKAGPSEPPASNSRPSRTKPQLAAAVPEKLTSRYPPRRGRKPIETVDDSDDDDDDDEEDLNRRISSSSEEIDHQSTLFPDYEDVDDDDDIFGGDDDDDDDDDEDVRVRRRYTKKKYNDLSNVRRSQRIRTK